MMSSGGWWGVVMSKTQQTECPICGDDYQRLGQHWAMGGHQPTITGRMDQILLGLMLGDGTIHHPPSSKNVQVQVSSINKTFVKWLSDELGWLSNGWTLKQRSDKVREGSGFSKRDGEYDIRDQYIMTTRRHSGLNHLKDWYSDGRAGIIDGIELSRIAFSVWFVSDGCLFWSNDGHVNPSISISSRVACNHPQRIKDMFGPLDVTPQIRNGRISFNVGDSKVLFEFLGDPIAGFDYKYVRSSIEDYRSEKEQFYIDHTTTTTGES